MVDDGDIAYNRHYACSVTVDQHEKMKVKILADIHGSAHKNDGDPSLFPSRKAQLPKHWEGKDEDGKVRDNIHGTVSESGFRIIDTVAGRVRIIIL